MWCSGECCRRFVLISPTCAMLSRENFLQNRMVEHRCHIWAQYGPYITTFTFLVYVHNMFHLHPLSNDNVFKIALIPQWTYFLLVRKIRPFSHEKVVITQSDACRWFYAPIYAKWLPLKICQSLVLQNLTWLIQFELIKGEATTSPTEWVQKSIVNYWIDTQWKRSFRSKVKIIWANTEALL